MGTDRRSGRPPAAAQAESGPRRQAREAALQVLYALDFVPSPAPFDGERARTAYWNNREGPPAGRPNGDTLVRGVVAHRDALDEALRAASPNWRLERMARVDRNVLRVAAWEMVFGGVPPEVAIDEAIEIAKRFGAEESAAFVNGTLDKLATQQGKLTPRG